MHAQRGFTLVEMLVAMAIAFILGWQLIALVHVTVLEAAHLNQSVRGRSTADRLEERLESDAATAWSVFVPVRDVNGSPNADGHELDFVTEDALRRPYWWSYDYDKAAQRIVKYAYAPGKPAVAGDTYDGFTEFRARAYPIAEISNPSSDAYDALFAHASVTNVDVPFGWNAAAGGGNRIVRVQFAAAGADRLAILASGTAPSRFTVVVEYTPPPPTASP